MGLSWQQGPLSTGAIGRFLVPEPLPKRLLYVEPLRRRMRVRSFVTLGLFAWAAVVALKYPIGGMALICICLIVYLRPEAPNIKSRRDIDGSSRSATGLQDHQSPSLTIKEQKLVCDQDARCLGGRLQLGPCHQTSAAQKGYGCWRLQSR